MYNRFDKITYRNQKGITWLKKDFIFLDLILMYLFKIINLYPGPDDFKNN